jgi:UTP--glucose-1-phosphate uridylyltransferase
MLLRKAIVPVAGLGTRLFPASHACKKELFPIVGPDQIARALLHYQLRDLVRAGFEDICVIVRPGEDAMVRAYFAGPGEAYLARLAKYPALLEEAREMAGILDALTFVEQRTQEGFGHAVYQARAFAADEPVLLCLGDHLFRGPCHAEMVDAFARACGSSVSAVSRITASQLHGYGTIHGRRLPDDPRLIEIERLIEKPAVEVARASLHVDGLPADTWLGWFGLHALSPGIFEILEEMIRLDLRVGGEIQMTDAQDRLRARDGYLAFEMTTSQRFDFGLPAELVESMVAFARP